MKSLYIFCVIIFFFLSIVNHSYTQGLSCQTATPMCNDITPYPINYTGTGAGTGPQAPAGPNYSCLLTTPNPTFFTLTITQTGTIQFDIQNSNIVDVDFVLYGPFPNLFAANAACNNLGNGGTGGNVIDCSYDPQAFETVDINNAVIGQVYILMITNFANVATNVFSTPNVGTGQIGCPCQLDATFSIAPLTNGTGTLTSSTNGSAEFKVCPGDTLYFNVGISADNIADTLSIFNSLTTISNAFQPSEYQIFGPFFPNAPFRDSMDFIVRITPGQNQTGIFTFDLGVQNSGTSDCFDSYPITVVVPGIPPLPPGDTICSGGSYQMNAGSFPSTASGSGIYSWTQISGAPATITGANTANATVTPPVIPSGDSLQFQLEYSYAGCVLIDTIKIYGYDIDINIAAAPNPVCAGQALNLSAILTDTVGVQTTTTCAPTYTSLLIPNAPLANTGTAVTLGDDQVSVALPIGFSFKFFCNTYTQFYLGSNGFITFSPGAPGNVVNQTIPNAAAPNNLIALCWTDLNPSSGGNILYRTAGVAPNRQLIVTYTNVPTFSGGDLCTVQAILFETTNVIELHITYAIDDIDFFFGSQAPLTIGLENATGTAILGTGINSITNSFVQNQALRITPNITTTTIFQPITYSWSPSSTLNNSTIYNPIATPNAPTTYTVTIQNGACFFTDSIQIGITGALAAPIVSCGGSTLNSITFNWSSLGLTGSGFYQYSINGGTTWNNVGTSLTTTLSGLSPGTTVTVLIRGNNGLGTPCSAGAPATISCSTLNCALSLTNTRQNVFCFGQATGQIDLTPVNGTAPFTYSWNNGATTQDISLLVAGNYTVTVSDISGCLAISTITITQPNKSLGLVSNIVNPSCFGSSNGCIGVDVSYGTGNYSYSWSNVGVSTDSICGLAAGIYYVTVSDAVAPGVFCTAIDTILLTQPIVLSATTAVNNVSCNGASNGNVNLSISGTGYSFNWSNGLTTEDISGLSAGIYNVTVTSNIGCTTITAATISQPSPINSNTVSITDATCTIGGSVDINANGGTGTLSYLWSNGSTAQDLNGVSSGPYTVTITDANNCTVVNGPNVVNAIGSPAATLTINNLSCIGSNNGSIDLNVSGGTPNYTYVWNNGSSSQDLSGLSSGVYSVTISDNVGCTASQTNIIITEPSAISVSNTTTNVNCNAASNGEIDITVSGGTGLYTFNWSNSASNEDLTGVGPGNYLVTVSDANACTTTLGPISITEPPVIILSNTSITNAGCGTNDGAINITVTGGTPTYTFQWSNGSTNQNISNLAPGQYDLIINDANACSFIQNDITVIGASIPNITANLNNEDCGVSGTGSIDLIVSSGTLPYTYNWNNGSTDQNINNLIAGTYFVTVTDVSGCTATANGTVITPFNPSLNAGVLPTLAVDTATVWGDFVILNGGSTQVAVNYQWSSFGPGNPNFSTQNAIQTDANPDQEGLYVFVISAESSDGCIQTDSVRVFFEANDPEIPTAFSPNGSGDNNIFQVVNINKTLIVEFKVYNRWGQLIYNDPVEAAWDGTYKGVKQPRDVYLYVIAWKSSSGGNDVVKRGHVTLMK